METIEERTARYERIRAMREEDPPQTYAAIGEALGLTRERVRKIANGGPPRPNGRPRTRQAADTSAGDTQG